VCGWVGEGGLGGWVGGCRCFYHSLYHVQACQACCVRVRSHVFAGEHNIWEDLQRSKFVASDRRHVDARPPVRRHHRRPDAFFHSENLSQQLIGEHEQVHRGQEESCEGIADGEEKKGGNPDGRSDEQNLRSHIRSCARQ
jgi:hypothetical protein